MQRISVFPMLADVFAALASIWCRWVVKIGASKARTRGTASMVAIWRARRSRRSLLDRMLDV
jgi:hypothetical protein